jgi:iron(III) transport system substrate-binding protein
MTMLKHPPHPNAARLLINFFLDPKSQYEFGKIGFNPVVDDAYKMLDPALAKQLNVPLMGTSDAGRIDEMTRLATEIFGK